MLKKILFIGVVMFMGITLFGQTNLAVLSRTSASTTKSPYTLNYLFNREISDKWESNGQGSQWLKFDLGKKVRFITVRLNNLSATDGFTIDVSSDGVTWVVAVPLTSSVTLFNKTNIYYISGANFTEYQYVRLSMGANQGYASLGEVAIFEDTNLFKSFSCSGFYYGGNYLFDGNYNTASTLDANVPGDKYVDIALIKSIKAAAIGIVAQGSYRIDTYLGTTLKQAGVTTSQGGTETVKIVDPSSFDRLRFTATGSNYIISEISLNELDINAASLSFNYNEIGQMTYRTIVFSGTKSAKVALGDTIMYMTKELNFVEDKFQNSFIRVCPNPTKGLINIETNQKTGEKGFQIQIYSVNGTLIESKTLTNEGKINISNKPSGTYIMNITVNGETHKWTIIKE
jgi:hypothetical protein